MQITTMISELGYEIDRSDLDERIKLWVQQAIDFVYSSLPWRSVQKSTTLVTVADTRTLTLPADFGELLVLTYDPSDSSGKRVAPLSPKDFFARYPGAEKTALQPIDFTLHENKLYVAPTPTGAVNLDLHYRIANSNIYEHTVTIKDLDGAAGTGVAVYIDEDAISTGEGKLYFVSPTNTDALLRIQTLDGHTHEFIIYDDDDAASLGVAWYFDEDSTDVHDRNLFVSPTNVNTVIRSETQRKHNHFLHFRDKDNAPSDGVAVYCDEDATEETERLLFVSPSDTNGTVTIVLGKEKEMPPFLEVYHDVVYHYALSFGLRFLKKYGEMNSILEVARMLLSSAVIADTRGDGREETQQGIIPPSMTQKQEQAQGPR